MHAYLHAYVHRCTEQHFHLLSIAHPRDVVFPFAQREHTRARHTYSNAHTHSYLVAILQPQHIAASMCPAHTQVRKIKRRVVIQVSEEGNLHEELQSDVCVCVFVCVCVCVLIDMLKCADT